MGPPCQEPLATSASISHMSFVWFYFFILYKSPDLIKKRSSRSARRTRRGRGGTKHCWPKARRDRELLVWDASSDNTLFRTQHATFWRTFAVRSLEGESSFRTATYGASASFEQCVHRDVCCNMNAVMRSDTRAHSRADMVHQPLTSYSEYEDALFSHCQPAEGRSCLSKHSPCSLS